MGPTKSNLVRVTCDLVREHTRVPCFCWVPFHLMSTDLSTHLFTVVDLIFWKNILSTLTYCLNHLIFKMITRDHAYLHLILSLMISITIWFMKKKKRKNTYRIVSYHIIISMCDTPKGYHHWIKTHKNELWDTFNNGCSMCDTQKPAQNLNFSFKYTTISCCIDKIIIITFEFVSSSYSY